MSKINIFCMTFNQNGDYITKETLEYISDRVRDNNTPEVLVLGFQETAFGFEYYWENTFIHRSYYILKKIRLNGIGNVGIRGIGLYILIKHYNFNTMVNFLEENWVRFNYQYFGKGAVSILVDIKGTKFLFINTHLPYSEYWEGGGINERVDSLNVIYDYIINKADFDCLFLIGDLNFRMHLKTKNRYASMITEDNPELFEMYLRNKSWSLLHFNDEFYLLSFFYKDYIKNLSIKTYGEEYGYQLSAQLYPFYNQIIDRPDFSPTYKVFKNRIAIQSQHEEKLDPDLYYDRWKDDRVPSWCDRILYTPKPFIKRIRYNNHDSEKINNSDHLPLMSLFLFEPE